ncbi:MAG: Phosphopantetheine adenylyltransferase [Chlamydiae bacterium]|nr:Phosphopantetheine adenylyltransferase [Chlamydiota bacterium]
MRQALFAGTFDPPTLGHLEIIQRARHLCDRLIIGIGVNSKKSNPLLSEEERIAILTQETSSLENVEIVSFNQLVIDYAKTRGIDFLIRGIRSACDLEWEQQMAMANHKLGGLDTFFLLAEKYPKISASLIRELASQKAPLTAFVPKQVETMLHSKLG